jgi:hypothetical protein
LCGEAWLEANTCKKNWWNISEDSLRTFYQVFGG